MKLEGIHHITAITGDAPANVEFYVGRPRACGSSRRPSTRTTRPSTTSSTPTRPARPGADLTFFEYPGARPGRAGAGMVHRVVWRVASPESIDFWERRLAANGVATERTGDGGLLFADPEGLDHELVVSSAPDAPLIADAPDVPREHALQGFDGVRAYATDPERSAALLRDTLGFTGGEDGAWEVRGDERGGRYVYDEPPSRQPRAGRGHDPPHRVRHARWRSTRRGRSGSRARARARRRSSTASTSARSTSASRAACCSSWPRWDRASTPTRTRRTSASGCRCRPSSSRCASSSSARLTPLPDPRAARTSA